MNRSEESRCIFFSFWKVVQQLTEKGKEMQTELEKFARHKQEHQQLLDGHFTLQKEHDDLRLNHQIGFFGRYIDAFTDCWLHLKKKCSFSIYLFYGFILDHGALLGIESCFCLNVT